MGDDDRQIKYINVGIELTNKVTKKIMENLEGEEKEAQLQIMRNTMKEYIKMEQEYRLRETVLDKLGRGLELEAANMDRDIESDYKTLYNTELDKESLQERNIVGDPRYQQLEYLIRGEAPGNRDLDLVLTEETQLFKDPWTRKPITDPVTNRKCGHTYERATVAKFLDKSKSDKKPLKCPVVGCSNNNITRGDLYPDADIKRKVMKENKA